MNYSQLTHSNRIYESQSRYIPLGTHAKLIQNRGCSNAAHDSHLFMGSGRSLTAAVPHNRHTLDLTYTKTSSLPIFKA